MVHKITAFLFAAICLVLLSPKALGADTTMTVETANDLFAAGNAFYRSQQYEEAREAYRQLLQAGYDTAPVLYNLGTVDARLGSTTLATAYLTKARNLRPRDPDIRANLDYVTPDIAPATGQADPGTAESLWSKVYSVFTAEEWLAVVWCALMLICCAGAALMLTASRKLRIVSRTLLWTGAIILMLVAAPASTQFYHSRVARKAMTTVPTELLSGPAARFTRVANLDAGQVVRDLGEAPSGYRHVRLASGFQGYVQDSALMQL